MQRFDGKVVIVTGAASGIGEATALRFAAEGARAAVVDRREDALKKVAAALPNDRAIACVADVANSNAVDAMIATTVTRFGRIDVLVNNAGIHGGGNPAEITDEEWRAVMSADADGVFYGCRAALPHLAKTRGSIITRRRYRDSAAAGACFPTTRPRARSST